MHEINHWKRMLIAITISKRDYSAMRVYTHRDQYKFPCPFNKRRRTLVDVM